MLGPAVARRAARRSARAAFSLLSTLARRYYPLVFAFVQKIGNPGELLLLKLATVDVPTLPRGQYMKRLSDDPNELRQEILTLIEQYEIALDLLSEESEVKQKMMKEVAELRERCAKLPAPSLDS
jgi:hypothetical protein